MQRGEFSIRPGSNTSEGHEASENRLLPQRAKVGYCPCCAPATRVAANVNYALGAHDVLKEKGSCPVAISRPADPSSIGHVAILRDPHTRWSWMGQGCAKPPHGQAAGAAPKMGNNLEARRGTHIHSPTCEVNIFRLLAAIQSIAGSTCSQCGVEVNGDTQTFFFGCAFKRVSLVTVCGELRAWVSPPLFNGHF